MLDFSTTPNNVKWQEYDYSILFSNLKSKADRRHLPYFIYFPPDGMILSLPPQVDEF